MAWVCIEGKCTDCDGVVFIEGLLKGKRVIEDLAGFSVFGAVDEYIQEPIGTTPLEQQS